MSDKFLPASELRRVRAGSYEQRVERLAEALGAHYQKAYQTQAEVSVLATHPDKVVFVAESQVFIASYQESAKGDIRFTRLESAEVETVAPDRVKDYVRKGCAEIVEQFFQGDLKGCLARARELLPYAEKPDTQHVLEQVEVAAKAASVWKTALQNHERRAQALLGPKASLDDALFSPKFTVLYENEDGDAANYSALVEEDLAVAANRLTEMYEEALVAVGKVEAKIRSGRELDEAEDVILMFGEFAQGFVKDLGILHDRTMRAVVEVSGVSSRGKLRDVLAEHSRPFELASRLVHEISMRV